MKKSILSIVLAIAVAMTALGAMFVVPATAANSVDFLTQASLGYSEGATAEMVDGALVYTATAAGQEMVLEVSEAANLNDYPLFEAKYTAGMAYDICFRDAATDKWMFGAGDFCFDFVGNNGAGAPLKAGAEDVKFSLTGAYTWTGAPLPAEASVVQIIFIAKEPGTITIEKCGMTDGLENYDLTTASYNEADVYENTVSLLGAADAWVSKTVNDSNVVVTDNNGSLVFSNTAGAWPSAYINYETPIVVNAEQATINANFTVKQNTTIYLYLNGKTADLSGYGDADFVAIKPSDIANPELGTGNYTGAQCLKDILPEGAVDARGNVEITAIAVFATGAAGATCVTVNALDLNYASVAVAPENLGNIDLDDDVDTVDALYCLNIAAGKIRVSAEQYANADYDMDGDVTFNDALALFAQVAGTTTDKIITNNG